LTAHYHWQAVAVAAEQLEKAGCRLAMVLDQTIQ